MALFSFTNPTQQQQPLGYQDGINQYNQQGQNMIDPGQAQLQQSNPIAMAGQQSLGQAFQQAGQQGTPMQQSNQQALAQGLMQPQQQPQNWWDKITTEASYPQPFAGGRSF